MQDFVKAAKITSAQKDQEIIAFSIIDKRAMNAEFAEIDLNFKRRKLDAAKEEGEIEEEEEVEEDDYIDVVSTLGLGSLAVAN